MYLEFEGQSYWEFQILDLVLSNYLIHLNPALPRGQDRGESTILLAFVRGMSCVCFPQVRNVPTVRRCDDFVPLQLSNPTQPVPQPYVRFPADKKTHIIPCVFRAQQCGLKSAEDV